MLVGSRTTTSGRMLPVRLRSDRRSAGRSCGTIRVIPADACPLRINVDQLEVPAVHTANRFTAVLRALLGRDLWAEIGACRRASVGSKVESHRVSLSWVHRDPATIRQRGLARGYRVRSQ